ncbi:arsenate-mycothiol transferase ArsC [Natronorubrum sulfidifaciens]|uniref:Protein-tyrosine phosphatase, low molecular weight n=1 Tax=Natronorubrum sulfidifaciens JCM 14089 TaxID=1230460 RepID=L9WDR1_9EURY|nr:low molecular weight phosphatase family protein [Natronorubrum sulfidifaciens]ELY47416.1 Protein-tyrosine phosphatase, low molecular weight [Natronorubrum sulfidifaciens JCM 14089]
MSDGKTHVALVCVQNAGRSQMATAYAEREREIRGLTDDVVIHSGGTHPADAVHDVVREAMADVGIDLSGRKPQAIATETLENCDYVATMGCSTLELEADTDVRDWDLPDPHGRDSETVREIRDDVNARVEALFDEIESARAD